MHGGMDYPTFATWAYDLIRLQTWYAWWLVTTQGKTYADLFEGRAVIDFWYWRRFQPDGVGPQWEEVKRRVIDKCEQHGNNPDTSALEQDALSMIQRFVDETYLGNMYQENYQETFARACRFHGFTYAYREEPESRIDLHFTNCFVPDSPFHHTDKLAAGLQALLEGSARERPDMGLVSCGSWLNDLPPFQSLFPPAWLDGVEHQSVAAHGGWWQQFMDRTGRMHKKNEAHLRNTGQFPYRCTRCRCGVGELRDHLASRFP